MTPRRLVGSVWFSPDVGVGIRLHGLCPHHHLLLSGVTRRRAVTSGPRTPHRSIACDSGEASAVVQRPVSLVRR